MNPDQSTLKIYLACKLQQTQQPPEFMLSILTDLHQAFIEIGQIDPPIEQQFIMHLQDWLEQRKKALAQPVRISRVSITEQVNSQEIVPQINPSQASNTWFENTVKNEEGGGSLMQAMRAEGEKKSNNSSGSSGKKRKSSNVQKRKSGRGGDSNGQKEGEKLSQEHLQNNGGKKYKNTVDFIKKNFLQNGKHSVSFKTEDESNRLYLQPPPSPAYSIRSSQSQIQKKLDSYPTMLGCKNRRRVFLNQSNTSLFQMPLKRQKSEPDNINISKESDASPARHFPAYEKSKDVSTADRLRDKVEQLKQKRIEFPHAQESPPSSKSSTKNSDRLNETIKANPYDPSQELPTLSKLRSPESSTHLQIPIRYQGTMPLSKLCIVALTKSGDETEPHSRVIDQMSLRRLMQLYSLIVYGKPIKISNADKKFIYQCQMCNYSNEKQSYVERHGESHVLILIDPEIASGFICQILFQEISKMKQKKSYICSYCNQKWPLTKQKEFRSHLIDQCLQIQGLGVNLDDLISTVQKHYPLIIGQKLSQQQNIQVQNRLDFIEAYSGSIPDLSILQQPSSRVCSQYSDATISKAASKAEEKAKCQNFTIDNEKDLVVYLNKLSSFLDYQSDNQQTMQ